jgi:hypothetical protein
MLEPGEMEEAARDMCWGSPKRPRPSASPMVMVLQPKMKPGRGGTGQRGREGAGKKRGESGSVAGVISAFSAVGSNTVARGVLNAADSTQSPCSGGSSTHGLPAAAVGKGMERAVMEKVE